jgi:SSS family solute:Na+ symporter
MTGLLPFQVATRGLYSVEALIVIAYTAGIFAIGIGASRKVGDFKDYVNTDSRLGIVLLTSTTLGANWGGLVLLGLPALAYGDMWMSAFYGGVGTVHFLMIGIFMGAPLRKASPYTMSEWFGLRFDERNAFVVTIFNFILGIGIITAQFLAFAAIATVFFDIGFNVALVVGAIIVTAYTVLSGLWGVSYTDFIQVVVSIAVAVGLMLYMMLGEVGSFGFVRANGEFPAGYFDPTVVSTGDVNAGWIFVFSLGFLWVADLLLNHATQRMVGARDIKTAYWSSIGGAVTWLLVMLLSTALGVYARFVLGPGIENPDLAFALLTDELLPAWIAGLVAASIIAGSMSTADSKMLGPATLIANETYQMFWPDRDDVDRLFGARVVVVLYAIMALVSAVTIQNIVTSILVYLTVGMGAIPAFVASFAWRRATAHAALNTRVGGGGPAPARCLYPPEVQPGMPTYYMGWFGLALGAILLVGISLIEGEEKVPHSFREPAVTDGGGGRQEVERARNLVNMVHY